MIFAIFCPCFFENSYNKIDKWVKIAKLISKSSSTTFHFLVAKIHCTCIEYIDIIWKGCNDSIRRYGYLKFKIFKQTKLEIINQYYIENITWKVYRKKKRVFMLPSLFLSMYWETLTSINESCENFVKEKRKSQA